jgi:hypothetical protein
MLTLLGRGAQMATAEQAQAAISSFHDTEHPELAVSGKRCSVKVAEPAKRDVQARGRGGTGGGRDGGFARGPNFQPRDQGYRGPPRDQGYSDRRRSPPRASHGAPRDEGGYGQTPALQQQHSRDQGSYSQPDRGYPQQYDNRGGGGGGGGGGYQDRDDRNSERPRQYDAPAPANRDYGDRGYSSRGSAGPPQEPYSSRSAPREGGAGGYSQQDRPPPRDTGMGGGQSQFSTTLSKDGATIHHQNATEPHTRRRKIGDQPFQTDDPVRTRDNRIVVAAVETRAGIVGMRTGRSSTALAPLRPVTIVVTRAIKILPLHTVDRPEDTRAVMRREMRLEIHHESVAVDQVDIHKRIILVGWATRDHTRTDQRAIHGGTEEDTSGRRTIIAPKSTHGTLNICSIGRAASRCLCFIAYVN